MSAESQSSEPSEAVRKMREDAAQRVQEQEDGGQERTQPSPEQAEASARQREIENALREDTVTLPVAGHEVEWTVLDGKTSEDIALIEQRVQDMGETPEALDEDLDEIADWMCSLLEDHSKPEWMTAEWFREHFTLRKRRVYLDMLNREQDLTESEIKKLLGRRSA